MIRPGSISRRRLLAALLVAAAASSGIVGAQDAPEVEREARALFTSIMSPYCPGSLLNECPSSQAAVLRDEIRQRLRRGDTRAQIEADLIETYGDDILASPPFDGFGLLSWLGAVAIFLGGLGAVSAWLRRRLGRTAAPTPGPVAGDDDLRQRMRAEIAADDEI